MLVKFQLEPVVSPTYFCIYRFSLSFLILKGRWRAPWEVRAEIKYINETIAKLPIVNLWLSFLLEDSYRRNFLSYTNKRLFQKWKADRAGHDCRYNLKISRSLPISECNKGTWCFSSVSPHGSYWKVQKNYEPLRRLLSKTKLTTVFWNAAYLLKRIHQSRPSEYSWLPDRLVCKGLGAESTTHTFELQDKLSQFHTTHSGLSTGRTSSKRSFLTVCQKPIPLC